MSTFQLTPWARMGIGAAGLNRFVLLGRIPAGWNLTGSAARSNGPYTFTAYNDGPRHTVTAQGYPDIPAALERLFALIGGPDLEEQLAASLAVREAQA